MIERYALCSKNKLLIVEDDESLASLLQEYLQRHGFIVSLLHKGSRTLEIVLETNPDLVILDLMLPDASGLDICRELRASWRGPVLMLTAMKDDADIVVGLEVGADDYVGKPVSPRVLLARIRALLRRGSADEKAEILRRGNLHINVPSREVTMDGNPVDLTTTEFDLLVLLARRAGRVQERSLLIEELRGISFHSFDRTVDVIVSRLRRKLGDSSTGELIKTVRGVGYLMVLQEES
ncbi:MAG: response regulator transcription factor [Candidatus Aegiribacteria sp.]|nr:response regulator transcription factor [Candidatus Aegiribacteria sp.]